MQVAIPVPRQYQNDMKGGIYAAWQETRHVLGVLPTGGGKSVVVGDIAREDDARRDQAVVIAHRQELVGQMSMHVARFGVQHRIIAPNNVIAFITAQHREEFGRSFVNPSARCSVAGVDTLVSRQVELKPWAVQIRRWTIDEAHHVLRENKWGTAVEMFPNAYGLGVTATPQRADGKGLGAHAAGVFGKMIVGPSMRDLIDMGSLTEYEIVIPESDFDVSSLKIANDGDYSSKQMREASKKSHIVGDVVDQYMIYAYGKQGITFATDVETATEIAARFNAMGIPAAVVSAKTPDIIRVGYIKRFREGKLKQLVNVDLFGEGFDVPAVEVVSMARPTASLAVYLQQFGRVLRPFMGKVVGLIIDHVSNVKRHLFPDRQRYWSLDNRDRRAGKARDPEEIELIRCLGCSHPYERAKPCCPRCGWKPPLPEQGSGGRSIEQVEGDLMLLDAATLARMRAATQLESPIALADRTRAVAGPLAAVANAKAQTERIAQQSQLSDAIALWAGHQRARGRPDSESYKRFYLTAGVDVATALTLSRADMAKLQVQVLGWIENETLRMLPLAKTG